VEVGVEALQTHPAKHHTHVSSAIIIASMVRTSEIDVGVMRRGYYVEAVAAAAALHTPPTRVSIASVVRQLPDCLDSKV
jgi:hypothetical protein